MNRDEILIRRVAWRLGGRSAATYQTLIAAGRVAVKTAEQEYDPRTPQSYRSYLKQRIHLAMFDALREQKRRAA